MTVPLGLDLSQSDAKIARACVHLEALKREAEIVITNRDFYTPRIEDDVSAYWCTIYAVPKPPDNPPKEYVLSVIFGDLIHDLRCALNYVVTELIDKSPGATLGNKHQFPIFETEAGYRKRVGDASTAVNGGQLAGIRHGLQEIWDLQPFHRDPKICKFYESGEDPISGHPLFHLGRLSNADKHRLLARITPIVNEVKITEEGGNIVEVRYIDLSDWKTHVEHKIARVLTKATAREAHFRAHVGMSVWFGTTSFPAGSKGYSINLPECTRMCETVDAIVNAFKSI